MEYMPKETLEKQASKENKVLRDIRKMERYLEWLKNVLTSNDSNTRSMALNSLVNGSMAQEVVSMGADAGMLIQIDETLTYLRGE